MKLIIESGSTKADWALFDDAESLRTNTQGFNPYLHNVDSFLHENGAHLNHFLANRKIDSIRGFFAGGDTDEKRAIIKKMIQKLIDCPSITIKNDLEAVRLITVPEGSGIISILGTGSFTAYVEDGNIYRKIVTSGHICNDEGSAYDIGRTFIQHYFSRIISKKLLTKIDEKHPLPNLETLKLQLFEAKDLKQFVANYCSILGDFKNEPEIIEIVKSCFNKFIRFQLSQFKDIEMRKVAFVGSVAFHFKEILEQCLSEKGYYMSIVVKNPIEALIEKYRKE